MSFVTLKLSRSLPQSIPLLARSISTSPTLPTATTLPRTTRRRNRRTQLSSPSHLTNSLINLYHLSSTFLPVSSEQASLDPAITHVFTPQGQYTIPQPNNPLDLEFSKSMHDARAAGLDQASASARELLWSDQIKKLSSGATVLPGASLDSYENVELDDTRAFDTSFLARFKKGTEPVATKRLRIIMDTLYGTKAGGQAGEIESAKSERYLVEARERKLNKEIEERRREMARRVKERQESEVEQVWA